MHKWDLDEALGQLVEMWLIEASEELDEAKRRYSVHPLTRAFASAKLSSEPEVSEKAHLRTGYYFLDFARYYGGENLHRYDALTIELENILAILDWCYRAGKWRIVVDFVDAMSLFLDRRGYWVEHIECGKMAIEAGKRLDDKEAIARHKIFALGWTHIWLWNYEEADRLLTEGQQLAKEIGYQYGLALALYDLGTLARRREDYEKARDLFQESLNIWQLIGDQRWIARAKGNLGSTARYQGDYDRASQELKDALEIARKINDEEGISNGLRRLGHMANVYGDLEKARQLYKEALRLKEKLGEERGMGLNKHSLALVEEKAGNFVLAISFAQDALEIFERLGMKKEIEETQELVERLEARIAEARSSG